MSQQLSASSLQLDTRVIAWSGKLSLIPTLDLRRQRANLPALNLSTARYSLSALIKAPRWIPGTDFLIRFTSNHVSPTGQPDRDRADLVISWNFKRF